VPSEVDPDMLDECNRGVSNITDITAYTHIFSLPRVVQGFM